MKLPISKNKRLKSKKLIDVVFEEGKSITVFPLKLVYINTSKMVSSENQAGFAVPKRNFKKAVTRNRIKRLMRESYRLQKPLFFNNSTTSYAFMFLYIGKKEPNYTAVFSSMKDLLDRFLKMN